MMPSTRLSVEMRALKQESFCHLVLKHIYVVLAALNLGCYPVRASRSQRHSNPRTYLTPRAPETVPATPRILDNGSEDRCPQLSPVQSGSQLARIATNVNSNTSVSQANRHNYLFLPQNCPSGHDQLMRMETNSPSNSGQVYPLYYGIHYQNAESQTGSPVQENLVSDTIIVGRPIGSSVLEPAEMGSLQNFFSSSNADIGGKRIGQQDIRHTDEKLLGKECDLSLRLGLFSDPCMQVEKKSLCETTDVGPSNTQDGGKLSDVFQQKSKEIPFFPERTVNDHFESFSRKCFMENEGHNVGAATRKRKATFGGNSEDEQFCKQPGSSSNNRRHGRELMFLFAFGEWSRVDFSLFVALEFLVDMNASRVIHRRISICYITSRRSGWQEESKRCKKRRMSFYALPFVIEMVTYVKDLFEDYFVMGCDV
ncbi:hypothetical protein Goarm_004572 [Gossypium armourianum]|uniref:Uncharacterized protein n=1 Tax=Gossypium armourianum TaxID=34283 RepID=A0A7J9JX72_9ROSI|nr:hypothetical protein [Gossypium armourianum]